MNKKEAIKKIKGKIQSANAIVIGAGAGLSASAGFTYGGERFHKYFSDFEEKYGFHDMYSGGFYPYNSLEEYWAYWLVSGEDGQLCQMLVRIMGRIDTI